MEALLGSAHHEQNPAVRSHVNSDPPQHPRSYSAGPLVRQASSSLGLQGGSLQLQANLGCSITHWQNPRMGMVLA